MTKIRLISFIACILLVHGYLRAQETGEDKLGTWLTYFGNHIVGEKVSLYNELELNHYEIASNFNQFWAILGANYHINEHAVITIGYGYFNFDNTYSEVPGEINTYEHRLFEQYLHGYNLGKLSIQNRYRIEHRFMHPPDSSFTRQRIRYRVQLSHPLYENWFLNVTDEVFFNLDEPVFDQNRLFVGLGYHLNKNISIQTGYLKLHFTGRSNERIQFMLNINTDLRKKKLENKES
jgi:Protein of unknown function (DUF2490)